MSRVSVFVLSAGCCLALLSSLHVLDLAVDFEGTNVFDPELPGSIADASSCNL